MQLKIFILQVKNGLKLLLILLNALLFKCTRIQRVHISPFSKKLLARHARRNVSGILWIYLTSPCSEEPIEGVWKAEAELGR